MADAIGSHSNSQYRAAPPNPSPKMRGTWTCRADGKRTIGQIASRRQAWARDCAAASPSSKRYDLHNPRHLLDFLVEANIRLVKLDFLQAKLSKGDLWPRREEAAAADGLVHLRDIHDLTYYAEPTLAKDCFGTKRPPGFYHPSQPNVLINIVSLSHAWESQQHADPWGWQLRGLVHLIEKFNVERRVAEMESSQKMFWHLYGQHVQYWVFVDFICLPQYKRSYLQDLYFQRAMRSMHLLYAHDCVTRVFRVETLTPSHVRKRAPPSKINIYWEESGQIEPRPLTDLVLNTTPYKQRGWCIAELQWMCTKKDVRHHAPMPPELFKWRVERGRKMIDQEHWEISMMGQDRLALPLKFTHRDDADHVIQLQEKVFAEQADRRRELRAWEMEEEEVIILAMSLPFFKHLRVLKINKCCRVSLSSATMLAKGLKTLTEVEEVCIQGQNWSNSAALRDCSEPGFVVQGFAHALAQVASIQTIDFSDCGMGDDGANALAGALKQWKDVRRIVLSRNGISDEGAESLAAALETCSRLEMVDLSQNPQVSSEAEDALDHFFFHCGLSPGPGRGDTLLWTKRPSDAFDNVWNLFRRPSRLAKRAIAALDPGFGR